MVESESGQDSKGRVAVVIYGETFKIDGFVDPPAEGEPIIKSGAGPLVVYDCKVYDRLQKDKFIFNMSRMEVRVGAVAIVMPRDTVTKEGVF